MDLNKTRTQKIRAIREKFLDTDHCELLHDDGSISSYTVYVIMNKFNHKLYVGKCKNLTDRASLYIRTFLSNNAKYNMRPIAKAIQEEGILSFLMFPVARYKSNWDACVAEVELIRKLNTTNPEVGYNAHDHFDFHPMQVPHTYSHSIDTKIVKGKLMLCIHPELMVVYVAVGMKIFGDLVGANKDIVKNCAKRPCKCRGFHVYYLNKEDREAMYEIRQNRKVFNDSRGESNTQYCELYEYVNKFAESPDPKIFTDLGYEIYFLTYNDELCSERLYDIQPIENFLQICNK